MRWRMSHTLHLRASCFVPAFYMSMKSLGECTLYSCFLCVGYFSDLGHFGLETCFTVHCAIFAQFEWFFSYTQRDSQPSVEVLSVTVLYLALSAVEWPFDTAQGLQCAALLQLHRTSTKRGQSFFEGKSRPCITAANVSCARLNVVVAFVVRSFVHALSWSVARIPRPCCILLSWWKYFCRTFVSCSCRFSSSRHSHRLRRQPSPWRPAARSWSFQVYNGRYYLLTDCPLR